jgi:DNA-binding NarL/FixJ family response regulator
MTRLLVVDDHPIFCDGLAGLLATLPDMGDVRTADSAEEALQQLADTPFDIVLMDINLPGASGVEATRQLTQQAPATAVLMVTMVDDDDSVYAALAAGARGYVLKDASADEILAAVRTVAAGGAVFGAAVATRILAKQPSRDSHPRDCHHRRTAHRTRTGRSRAARRRRDQPSDRRHPWTLNQDRPKPHFPHPRQTAGSRPNPGGPAGPRNHRLKNPRHELTHETALAISVNKPGGMGRPHTEQWFMPGAFEPGTRSVKQATAVGAHVGTTSGRRRRRPASARSGALPIRAALLPRCLQNLYVLSYACGRHVPSRSRASAARPVIFQECVLVHRSGIDYRGLTSPPFRTCVGAPHGGESSSWSSPGCEGRCSAATRVHLRGKALYLL